MKGLNKSEVCKAIIINVGQRKSAREDPERRTINIYCGPNEHITSLLVELAPITVYNQLPPLAPRSGLVGYHWLMIANFDNKNNIYALPDTKYSDVT